MTRREWMLSSAALSAAAAAQSTGSGQTISIASGNGLRATARAVEMMKAGADTLDAVIAGAVIRNQVVQSCSDAGFRFGLVGCTIVDDRFFYQLENMVERDRRFRRVDDGFEFGF